MRQTTYPELATELTTDDPVEIEKLIYQYLEAMKRMNENIARNWEEIERLPSDGQLRLELESRLTKERESWQQQIATLEEEKRQLREQVKRLPPVSE